MVVQLHGVMACPVESVGGGVAQIPACWFTEKAQIQYRTSSFPFLADQMSPELARRVTGKGYSASLTP